MLHLMKFGNKISLKGVSLMNAVLTGDNINITPYIVLMIVAIIVIVGVVIYKKRKK